MNTAQTAASVLTLIGKHSRTEQLAIINGVRVILGDIELDESDEPEEDEDDDQKSDDADSDDDFDEDEDEEEPKSVADLLVASKSKSKSNAPTLESVLAILKQHPEGLRKAEILAKLGVEPNGKPLGNMFQQQFKDWKARGHITLTNADGHPSATRWVATGKEQR